MSEDPHNHKFGNYFKKIFTAKPNEDVRETIEDLIEEAGNGDDAFSEHEQLLLNNILYLKEIKACRVMIPRADIISFQKDGSVEDLARLMVGKGHSRIPIYGDSLDDILGMLHVIDLTKSLLKEQDKTKVSELEFNKIKLVSPDDSVLDLLKEMQQTKTHMAIVVDDYGGVCGLLTIEDLLEEIVGEIEDEYDLEEQYIINLQENGLYVADAKAYLEDVEEITGICFDNDNEEEERTVDTLGGYVFELAQRIPSRGEIIEDKILGLKFKIIDVDPSRIKKIMIMQPENPKENADTK